MKKISINTLGCKVNQYESASFLSGFEDEGHRVVPQTSNPDIVVINTCCVTAKAASQSRQEIRRAVRENPNARLVITGCYAQLESSKISNMQELQGHNTTIIGNGHKDILVDQSLRGDDESRILCSPADEAGAILSLPVKHFNKRTRAYLKIQDGCNAFCSYCIVPYTRGRSRSLPPEKVIEQALFFQEQGFKEIVITGIHVGYYGNDLSQNESIDSICEKLCRATPDIRYRLSSIEPLEISDRLLECICKYDNFMPHLHIPLQSADDDILLRMNRRYTTDTFATILQHCTKQIKDLAIGIDILAGFPGESSKQFDKGMRFLQDLDFTYLHAFPYSIRPGTPAAAFDGQVKKDIKQERVARLRSLDISKKTAFYKRFKGDVRPVLMEGKRDKNGLLKGFSDNYLPITCAGSDDLMKTIVDVRILDIDNTHITGERVSV